MAKIIPFPHRPKRPCLPRGVAASTPRRRRGPSGRALCRLLGVFVVTSWPVLRCWIVADACVPPQRVVCPGGLASPGALIHLSIVGGAPTACGAC